MSREIVITDSGCLISLERINRLDILPALFSQVLLPPAVQAEFGVVLPWLKVVPPQDRGMVAALKMLVDEGEAEAIALAYELQYRLIIDDLQGRKVARDLGLQMTGTIGTLVMAKQQGIIPALKPVIEALEGVSFYLSEALKAEALNLVGE
jgi:predicted nucleic acid-binding protein